MGLCNQIMHVTCVFPPGRTKFTVLHVSTYTKITFSNFDTSMREAEGR